MYFQDHNPPHFHAEKDEKNGIFEIDTLKMIEGDLPQKAQKEIKNWAEQHQQALKEMWDSQEITKI
jgi:hypothetical protein